jgi:uncharacterized LabA/DUF88 family protein/cold shock CspA family protein
MNMTINSIGKELTRIGVFYDGNYFLHVSNYYCYNHERKSRISISGLHNFIRYQVAQHEGRDERLCQIVDAHYFRGRLSASEAMQRANQLYYDRVFDDILMAEGVTTHYLPIKTNFGGYKQEKGIDVWLALEAFELALYKKFDVLVLIASDGDYVPLIRKINTLGTRVMVLSWDFEYTTFDGEKRETRTSQDLLEEVTYPVAMHEIIENRVRKNEPLINNLFVPPSKDRTQNRPAPTVVRDSNDPSVHISEIFSLKNGYGFIKYPPNNLFFHYQSLIDEDFNNLRIGDKVRFVIARNADNEEVATDVELIS